MERTPGSALAGGRGTLRHSLKREHGLDRIRFANPRAVSPPGNSTIATLANGRRSRCIGIVDTDWIGHCGRRSSAMAARMRMLDNMLAGDGGRQYEIVLLVRRHAPQRRHRHHQLSLSAQDA